MWYFLGNPGKFPGKKVDKSSKSLRKRPTRPRPVSRNELLMFKMTAQATKAPIREKISGEKGEKM